MLVDLDLFSLQEISGMLHWLHEHHHHQCTAELSTFQSHGRLPSSCSIEACSAACVPNCCRCDRAADGELQKHARIG